MQNITGCNLINKIINFLWWKNFSFFHFFLLPLSYIYIFFNKIIQLSYEKGFLKKWKSPIPVIIVGNLTVGGNGKTPMVIWLAKKLKKYGLNIGIISRGYNKKIQHPILINENSKIEKVGDEPMLIYQKTKASVVVFAIRSIAIKFLILSVKKIDLIICDDGLQHYSLERDFEIVMIDGVRRFGNGYFLPAGPIRENTKNVLNRANAIFIKNGVPKKNEMLMQIIFSSFAFNVKTSEKKLLYLFKNIKIIAIAGIGNPEEFFFMLKKHNIFIKKRFIFFDHQNYNKNMLKKVVKKDEILFMTEKDAIKCKNFASKNWWYIPIKTKISAFYERKLINKIKNLL